jgi:hypothetical protein
MRFKEIEYGYRHELMFNVIWASTNNWEPLSECVDRIMSLIREAYNLGKEQNRND